MERSSPTIYQALPLLVYMYLPKLFEIEKEIARQVAQGDKHSLRKSADHKEQNIPVS